MMAYFPQEAGSEMLQASLNSAGMGMVGQLPNLHLGMVGEGVLKENPRYLPMDEDVAAATVEELGDWLQVNGNVGAPLPDRLLQMEDVPQRSEVWHLLRVGRLTASVVSDLLCIKEPDSVTFLRRNGVKVMVPKGSPEYLDALCEWLTTKQLRQQGQISSHEEGYRACAMHMGTNGEHMGVLTVLKYIHTKKLDLYVREAGVRHLSYIPESVLSIPDELVGGSLCMDFLPPIMVSPDGYLVRYKQMCYVCQG